MTIASERLPSDLDLPRVVYKDVFVSVYEVIRVCRHYRRFSILGSIPV